MENSNIAKACRDTIRQYGAARNGEFFRKLVSAAVKDDEAMAKAVSEVINGIADDVTAIITISDLTTPIYAAALYSIADGLMATLDEKGRQAANNIRNNIKACTIVCNKK